MTANKAQEAAELVGKSVATVEGAAESMTARARQGIRQATSVVHRFELRDEVEEQIHKARTAGKKAVKRTIKAAKKQATSVSRKATRAKKPAKKRATSASHRATGAKKAAKNRPTSVSRKATGATKTAKKRPTSVSRKATASKKRLASGPV